jgi:hypothetical protein
MPGIETWGPQVSTQGLPDLYSPQEIRQFSPTPAGIDNLALSSIDVFLLPAAGGSYEKHEVHFEGYFQVARGAPTTNDWATSEVYVNMTDLILRSKQPAKGLGEIRVRKNPDLVSAGQVFASGGKMQAKACRIAASVVFEAPERGMSFFNKEPVLLMNGGIKSVPPVEDPNGTAHNYLLPLYDTKDPNGRPVVYIESLRYTVGNYITREAAELLRRRG